MCVFDQTLVAYPVLSADPGRRVEADNREEGYDLQPTDEQLLICDQVSRQRATWKERDRQTEGEDDDIRLFFLW